MDAATKGNWKKVRWILRKHDDVDVNGANNDGRTALHCASIEGHLEVVRELLSNRAYIHATSNEYCRTALHYASQEGYFKIVQELIAKGASIHATDKDGWTPLHYASRHGHLEIVQELIRKGADIHDKTRKSESALDIGRCQKNASVVQFLEQQHQTKTTSSHNTLKWLSNQANGSVVDDSYPDEPSLLTHLEQVHDAEVGRLLPGEHYADLYFQRPISDTPYMFLSHTGKDNVKEEIARPTFWFLTKICGIKAFLDDGCARPGDRKNDAIVGPAYECTHALVLLSPSFRRRRYCVQELNTFIWRSQKESSFAIIPALWLLPDAYGYSEAVKDKIWLKAGTSNAADYLTGELWPALLRVLHLERMKYQNDLEEMLFRYVVTHRGRSNRPIPPCLESFARHFEMHQKSVGGKHESQQITNSPQGSSLADVPASLNAHPVNQAPCLFIVLPADQTELQEHPRSWIKGQSRTDYLLYFVCSHSFRRVRSPIQFQVSKDWVRRIAPFYACSLYALQIAAQANVAVAADLGLSDITGRSVLKNQNDKMLNEMLDSMKEVLQEEQQESSCYDDLLHNLNARSIDGTHIRQLDKGAFDPIVEKAADQQEWLSEMKQVRKHDESRPQWVLNEFANRSYGYALVT